MSDDAVYLRRVRDPNPILVELARQVVDLSERLKLPFHSVTAAAGEFGVPLAYVLDEQERRERERHGE